MLHRIVLEICIGSRLIVSPTECTKIALARKNSVNCPYVGLEMKPETCQVNKLPIIAQLRGQQL